MLIHNLINQAEEQITFNRPFVIYSDFGIKNFHCLFQKDQKTYTTKNYTESGFVLAPFSSKNLTYLIPDSHSNLYSYEFNNVLDFKNNITSLETDYKQHYKLVNKAVAEISNTALQKVVVARDLKIKCAKIDKIKLFLSIVDRYPEAYNFCWFHPNTGFWIGASPEPLISLQGKNIKTISLAGTKAKSEKTNTKWDKKNYEEQEIVTSYIKGKLEPYLDSYSVTGPKTIQAGNLLHLQTIFEGKLKSSSTLLSNLIALLHPTPAVCGFPKSLAMEFIDKYESIDRKYYSGFLGKINCNKSRIIKHSNLVVNLRCMHIEHDTITLYAGGGITSKSCPEKEWKETVLKMHTLKSLI